MFVFYHLPLSIGGAHLILLFLALCYNMIMRLPSSRMGWALMPGAIVLGLSGLAVAAQSGLFTGTLEDEAREYAVVVWGIASVVIVIGATIILLNIIKKMRTRR